jgi:hypothetical protein
MTAELLKCLSLSVLLLLTGGSSLGEMSVSFCATHTYFVKCRAVVAFSVGDVTDIAEDPTVSTINSTFSDGKGIRIHHYSGICTRLLGVTAIFKSPMAWFSVTNQACQMVCC